MGKEAVSCSAQSSVLLPRVGSSHHHSAPQLDHGVGVKRWFLDHWVTAQHDLTPMSETRLLLNTQNQNVLMSMSFPLWENVDTSRTGLSIWQMTPHTVGGVRENERQPPPLDRPLCWSECLAPLCALTSRSSENWEHLSKAIVTNFLPPSPWRDALPPSSSPPLSQGLLPLRWLTTCFLSLECWFFRAGFLGDNDMAHEVRAWLSSCAPGGRRRLLIGASGLGEAWKQQSRDSRAPPCAGWACLGNDCGSGWSHHGWGRIGSVREYSLLFLNSTAPGMKSPFSF